MRSLLSPGINQWRVRDEWVLHNYGSYGDANGGCFSLPSPIQGRRLNVIAASGHAWDHVSVSTPRKIPTWVEMDFIKRMFFEDNEVAMQLHVPPADHINVHPNCLHLWRPHLVEIPLPPRQMVG